MAMMDGYRSFNANMRLTSADIARRLGRNETAIEFIRYGSTSARRYAALTLTALARWASCRCGQKTVCATSG